MSLHDDLRDMLSGAVRDIHTSLGHTLLYSNLGAADVTLVGVAREDSTDNQEVLGTETAITTKVFEIARQTNFPPAAGVAIDDRITFNSVKYYITSVEVDQVGAMYTLTTERRKAERL